MDIPKEWKGRVLNDAHATPRLRLIYQGPPHSYPFEFCIPLLTPLTALSESSPYRIIQDTGTFLMTDPARGPHQTQLTPLRFPTQLWYTRVCVCVLVCVSRFHGRLLSVHSHLGPVSFRTKCAYLVNPQLMIHCGPSSNRHLLTIYHQLTIYQQQYHLASIIYQEVYHSSTKAVTNIS
jgi:hypothetical protein